VPLIVRELSQSRDFMLKNIVVFLSHSADVSVSSNSFDVLSSLNVLKCQLILCAAVPFHRSSIDQSLPTAEDLCSPWYALQHYPGCYNVLVMIAVWRWRGKGYGGSGEATFEQRGRQSHGLHISGRRKRHRCNCEQPYNYRRLTC
jgi:hypothetical protein